MSLVLEHDPDTTADTDAALHQMPTPSCSHLTSRPLMHRRLTPRPVYVFTLTWIGVQQSGAAARLHRAHILPGCTGTDRLGVSSCAALLGVPLQPVQHLVSSPGVTLLQSLLGQRASFFFFSACLSVIQFTDLFTLFCLSVHYLICQIPSHPFSSYR